jgi:cytidylate kinase
LTIAIDGPAGSGKSTVAKRLAKEFGLRFLDTGAMYRCVALLAERSHLGPDDGAMAAELAERSTIEFEEGDPQRVFLNGEDVTDLIRSLEIGELASSLSAHSAVRLVLAERQKAIVAAGGFTLEGRDTTTVIAPNARIKIYLTATPEIRAKRRCDELLPKGDKADFEEVKRAILERDERDTTRLDSPLKVAPDAHVIDTSEMSIEEVVSTVRSFAQAAMR